MCPDIIEQALQGVNNQKDQWHLYSEKISKILNRISECPHGVKIDSSIICDECEEDLIWVTLIYLKLYGVVSIADRKIEIPSESAKLLIKSIAEYIENDISFLSNWDDKKGKPNEISEVNALFSNSFLFLIEKKRRELLKNNAHPIKENEIIRGVIKCKVNQNDRVLMQFDPRVNQYQLIGGMVEKDDFDSSFAMSRELAEELPEAGLEHNKNFRLKEIYKSKEMEHFLSNKFCVLVGYNVQLYLIYDLEIDKMKWKSINNKKENAWISYGEIEKGKSRDGRQIFPLNQDMLEEIKTASYSFQKTKIDIKEILSYGWVQLLLAAATIGGVLLAAAQFIIPFLRTALT